MTAESNVRDTVKTGMFTDRKLSLVWSKIIEHRIHTAASEIKGWHKNILLLVSEPAFDMSFTSRLCVFLFVIFLLSIYVPNFVFIGKTSGYTVDCAHSGYH